MHNYFVKEQHAASSSEPNFSEIIYFSELKFEFFFKSILKQSAVDVSFYVSKSNYSDYIEIFIKLIYHLPNLRIHVYTDDCLFDSFKHYLTKGTINSCCFGIAREKWPELIKSKESVNSIKRVFYKKNEFQYLNFGEPISIPNDLLLVLMPAWNNEFPPFGLAHIAGMLETLDLTYDVLDLNCHFWSKFRGDSKKMSKYKNLINWVNKALYQQNVQAELKFIFTQLTEKITPQTKYIGFSLFNLNLISSEEAMRLVRSINPDIKIFCGGPQCSESWAKEAIESNLIDAAVIGEGEESVIELIKSWQNNTAPESIAGTLIKFKGQASVGPVRALMDMNDLPKPIFSKFPLFQYDSMTLPIYSSRGCVARCSFCSETIYWKKFRALNPEKIVSMMEDNIRNFGINSFQFNDSLMNGSHKLLEDMCDLIIKKSLDVKFVGYSRFDKKLTPEILGKMAKAGCGSISFGFESGSQKVVDLMNKKVFVDNYESILESATKAGIDCYVCIIVGFPGETWKDFLSTLSKVIKMRNYITGLNLSIMEISKNSLIEKDFAKYNIVNDQGRYWRTANWTNFYLMRVTRYFIFKVTWKLVSGQNVSIHRWNPGYLMFVKKIIGWLRMKYLSQSPQAK